MADKKDYVVTQENTLDHSVGDVISLTKIEADRLINKVRPRDEHEKQTTAGRKSNAEKRVIELEGDLADAHKVIAQISSANPNLTAAIQVMIEANKTAKAEAIAAANAT